MAKRNEASVLKFSKEQIVASKKYSPYKDFFNGNLKTGQMYSESVAEDTTSCRQSTLKQTLKEPRQKSLFLERLEWVTSQLVGRELVLQPSITTPVFSGK